MFENYEDRINRITGEPYTKKTYLVTAQATVSVPKNVIMEGKSSLIEFIRDDIEELETKWDDVERIDQGWDKCVPRHFNYVYKVSTQIEAENEDEADRIALSSCGLNTFIFVENIEEI